MCFLFANQLIAMSYIDNPNFELHLKGWQCPSDCKVVSYDEHTRNRIFRENYVSSRFLTYDLNPPVDVPLYYSIEVGYARETQEDDPLQIQMEIREDWDEGWKSVFNILTQALVTVTGEDQWHIINSVYPVYRKNVNSSMSLVLMSAGMTQIHLNYAQVGTDPASLGGRGPRARPTPSRSEL